MKRRQASFLAQKTILEPFVQNSEVSISGFQQTITLGPDTAPRCKQVAETGRAQVERA